MHGNVFWHHQSFVVRDYKAWCQMAVFILHPYLTVQELDVLLKMTKVYTSVENHFNFFPSFLHCLLRILRSSKSKTMSAHMHRVC